MASIVLTKFDVAERQLLQAIRLFFSEGDGVSVHTLSEAAAQVLHDIGKESGANSIFRDSDHIVHERRKEWLAAVFKSRNFFKHADKDKDEVHEFKAEFNDMSLLDSVNMYNSLKKCWTPETLLFFVWFSLKYPNFIRDDGAFTPLLKKLSSADYLTDPSDKGFFLKGISALRDRVLTIPNVSLSTGRPSADA